MDYNFLNKAAANQAYIAGMRPVLKKGALFSDATSDYVIPAEPSPYGQVAIRFRTAHNNVDNVFLIVGEERYLMYRESQTDDFDYYVEEIQLENEKITYYFEIHSGKIICYYDIRGLSRNIDPQYHFKLIPGFRTPSWAKGAVMYQIYVDRFFNGDKSNDVLSDEYSYIGDHVKKVDDWYKYPDSMGVREFYGGDLKGVMEKLDYLEDLGIEVIYFNPLFVSPSNHKYDIQDYDYIDPHFGRIVHDSGELLSEGDCENANASRYIDRVTNKANLEASNALFAEVVEEAHKRGIKVILDGVFNHCGSFNKWMDREKIYEKAPGYEPGAHISEDSPYHDYFSFQAGGKWPYNGKYDGWWGHDTLPKLNYEGSRELYDYVLSIAAKWVSPPYNADGWRLDVAADLGHSPEFNHKFWRDFRRAVKRANPNAIILAEHYGSPEAWLQGREWDSVMNYDAFMEPLTWFLTGMQKHSDDFRPDYIGDADAFWGSMYHNMACFSEPSLLVAMNELSNHDHSRFLTRTNHKVGRTNNLGPEAANEGIDKAVMREAVMVQMTWPGAPTIYYGDEAGLCGFTDPDNRRTYPWGHEDTDLIEYHKRLISIHKWYPEFKTGSMKFVDKDYNLLAFGRFQEKGGHSLVVINNADYEIEREIKVWYLGVPKECRMELLIKTDKEGFSTEREKFPVEAGKLKLKLGPKSGVILRYEDESVEEAVKNANSTSAFGEEYGKPSLEPSSWFNFGDS